MESPNSLGLQEKFLPVNFNDAKLPDLSETDIKIRAIDIAEFALAKLNKEPDLFDKLAKSQGSIGLQAIDTVIAEIVTEAIDQAGLPQEVAEKAKKAVTIKDWTGVESGSGEIFALRELIVRTNQIKYDFVQRWIEASKGTALPDVAEREYMLLMPALAAIDQIYLRMVTEKYPITSDERRLRKLINANAIVREVDGQVVEIPLHEAYAQETSIIVAAYSELISSLEKLGSTTNNDLRDKKLAYYRTVRDAFASSDQSKWEEADVLLAGQIRNGDDIFHLHPIEEGYMEDRIIRAPEIGLRAPDVNSQRAREISERTKSTMMASWQSEYVQDFPAIAKSLELVRNSNAVVRHFLGAGSEMDLKPAGQIVPNEFPARSQGGVDSSLDLSSVRQRFPAQERAFAKIFGEEALEALLKPRVDFDVMVGEDVGSHELGHPTALTPDTYDRLGGRAMIYPYIEEWKATVSGAIGTLYIPFKQGTVSNDELVSWVVHHIARGGRYAGVRSQPFAAAYFRKSMMILRLLEEQGIIISNPEGGEFPWQINLDQNKVEAFFEALFQEWREVVTLYDSGTEDGLRDYLSKHLTVTPFIEFLCERLPIKNKDNGTDVEAATPRALIQLPAQESIPTVAETVALGTDESHAAVVSQLHIHK